MTASHATRQHQLRQGRRTDPKDTPAAVALTPEQRSRLSHVEPEAAVNLNERICSGSITCYYFMMQTTMSDRPQAPAAADDDASHGTLESTLSTALDTTSTVALSSIIRDALLRGEDITNTFRRSHNSNNDDNANGEAYMYEESTLASQHSFIYDDVHSKILTADILGGDIKLDPLEKRAIYREIHGHVASGDEDEAMHGRIEQLEREIWKLPKEDKAALMRVLRKNPLLFVVSSQTKLFLSSEDFDAPRAARRIARYWQRREDLFGEDNVLKDGDVPSPNLEDYNRFYSRCEDILEDADADEEGRAIARDYIHAVDHQKIKAMDQVVAQALDKRKDILKWLVECKLIRYEKQNSSSDYLSMVIAGSSEEKMRFIRSEFFIEKNAASRLVKYWSYKYELFGPGRGTKRANEDSSGQLSCDLSRKILLDDDRMAGCPELLDRGFFRIAPDTDAFGRIIVVFNMKKLTDVFDEINEGDGETTIVSVGMLEFCIFVSCLIFCSLAANPS